MGQGKEREFAGQKYCVICKGVWSPIFKAPDPLPPESNAVRFLRGGFSAMKRPAARRLAPTVPRYDFLRFSRASPPKATSANVAGSRKIGDSHLLL